MKNGYSFWICHDVDCYSNSKTLFKYKSSGNEHAQLDKLYHSKVLNQ